jgi:hypothetical protein
MYDPVNPAEIDLFLVQDLIIDFDRVCLQFSLSITSSTAVMWTHTTAFQSPVMRAGASNHVCCSGNTHDIASTRSPKQIAIATVCQLQATL